MAYARTVPVEFNHCDPAGIVFYPRYFEMVNSVVENFFLDDVGHSFARMMDEGAGVPTARIEANFRSPSRLGDRLDFTLDVTRVGGASVTFAISAACKGKHRFGLDLTLVWVTNGGKATQWPDSIRTRLAAHLKRASA
jgi:4-hydroxybenzoyl-CoA thioesterase